MSTEARPPSVSLLLESDAGRALAATHGHKPAVAAIRAAIAEARQSGSFAPDRLLQMAAQSLSARRPNLRPVWNLTGTVLHTNLGRALLSERAVAAATVAMQRPVALEYDVAGGARGERDSVVREALRALTGAEGAVLVNNNAAAVTLMLDTFARGGEVIVSRGELIEIGGAFRLPDIMAATGARLREVGTTNRTHLRDYEAAIGEDTRLIMKVHPSNFRIEGFTSEVTAAVLAPLARKHGIPLVNDLGSGTLVDLSRYALPKEPTVAEAIAEGADIVTFSGDKLLGGPQAGLAVGRAELIGRMARNPLKRALRLDKIRLAALEATLEDYRTAANPDGAVPTLFFLARRADEIAARAARLVAPVAEVLGEDFEVRVEECRSQVGSGASPTATLPSAGLAIRGDSLEDLASRLRSLPEPVIGRIAEGALWLDLRCLAREDEARFLANLAHLAPR
ncbi:L-seryl-tRNA(Sec) selenium transferase [Altererythrobacter soli]|uniref:L-seryl-tRNA(Sec) selenium transferase n=1 Tax=Croceibacterium soli TaxID=1739690 RepID=A0A6I4UPT3_9SPHN|nr:L-seryl-tRNA(Sec) selenium transferase [Croceibacterium soli]MXP40748.1 L-seryl-tRNA(Sec) selenium transferase [Croceibacterium soli]